MKYWNYILMLLLLTACYEPIDEEAENNKKEKTNTENRCELQISVFSSSEVCYPVNVIIFDKRGERIKDGTLTQKSSIMTLSLPWDKYRIVALSGTAYYHIPNTFTLDSQISLSPYSLPMQALYMGEADVILASEKSYANLQLMPQTAEIEVIGQQISPLTQQIRIYLSSLYTKVNLQSSYEDLETFSLPCDKKGNKWQAGPYHLFPGQGTSTIVSMEVIRTDSTLNYGFILPYPIKAGYKYELKPSPSGLVANDVLIDPSNTQNSAKEDTLLLYSLPKVPEIWDGHVVINEEWNDDNEADLWLLSTNEWEDIHSANSAEYSTEASEIAATYQEGGTLSGRITQWHIPTKEEAYAIRSLYAGNLLTTLNNLLSSHNLPTWSLTDADGDNLRYLCNDAFHTFSLVPSSTSITKGGTKATYRLRLIKKIHVKVRKY